MSSPLPYLVRMLLFLAAVAGLAYVLHEDLLRVFLNTPILNGVIVGVLVIGIFFVMRQVISLWPEVKWLRRFQHREEGAPPLDTHSLNLLAPLATMLGERQDRLRLSPTATRAVLDGIATRLDERRELTRYLIGLLIFLGLLGTFWGLLETISAVADAIGRPAGHRRRRRADVRQAQGEHRGPAQGHGDGVRRLAVRPVGLAGAGLPRTAGEPGAGPLPHRARGMAGERHAPVERRLQVDGEQGVSAYVEALLERTADGLDDLTAHAAARRGEPRGHGRRAAPPWSSAWRRWPRRCAASRPCSPAWPSSRSSCARRSTASASAARPRTTARRCATHQRAIESHLAPPGRGERCAAARALADELRGAWSSAWRERTLATRSARPCWPHQRAIESHLARLVDENVRSRTALADELRGEFRLLARTIASTARGAVHPPGDG